MNRKDLSAFSIAVSFKLGSAYGSADIPFSTSQVVPKEFGPSHTHAPIDKLAMNLIQTRWPTSARMLSNVCAVALPGISRIKAHSRENFAADRMRDR
jgi:hypothetical protein